MNDETNIRLSYLLLIAILFQQSNLSCHSFYQQYRCQHYHGQKSSNNNFNFYLMNDNIRKDVGYQNTIVNSMNNNDNHIDNADIGNCDDEESIINKQLREFFIREDIFEIANRVMDTYISDSFGSGKIKSNKGILTRYNENNNKNNDDEADLLDPLFFNKRSYNQSSTTLIESSSSFLDQKKKGQSFKITVAYKGSSYCGWQIQPNNEVPSVQQTLIEILDPILGNNDKSNNRGKQKIKPIDIRVCGRTDAGVNAMAQVCRVRTSRSLNEVTAIDVQNRINSLGQSTLCCTNVERVNDKFHPTFGARSRAYVYLIDTDKLNTFIKSIATVVNYDPIERMEHILNQMLSKVEGLELDYIGLSYGKVKTSTTLCTLSRARVSRVSVNDAIEGSTEQHSSTNEALCFELVGDRFLRRMIRIMVSTLLNLALQEIHDFDENFDQCTFLKLIQTCDRKLSSKPAAPDGLIFVAGSFDEK